MNTARETEVKEQIKTGLLKIAANAAITRADAFGWSNSRSADFVRVSRVLKRLSDDDLIESTGGDRPGDPKIYTPKNAERLLTIADDEIELSRLIWPGRALPKSHGGAELARALESPAEVEPETPIAASAQSTQPSRDEVIEGVLKMLAAVAENVIYLREKVDALDSVACSHCATPEAHR